MDYKNENSIDSNDTFPILINACYGGFGLSEKAIELYTKKKEGN
jgi:hypothetical protein